MSMQRMIQTLKHIYLCYTNAQSSKHLIDRAKKNSDNSVLTEQEKSEVKEFWKRCGSVSLAFHNYYKEKTGMFYQEYVPEDIYFTKIDPFYNNIAEAYYLDNKCYYGWIFHGIPMPETVCKRMNNIWYFGEYEICTFERVVSVLENEKEVFVKKASDSYGGAGVFYLNNSQNDICEQFLKIIRGIKGDLIVQRPVIQHEELSRINTSSVNTIRVLSRLNKNGNIDILSVILRMGVAGARVDNASKGGITCGVDANGRCKAIGYYSYVNSGRKLDFHPTSNISFSDICIPNYEMLLSTVKLAHARIPHFRLVSWDMAIDCNAVPVLIEANLFNGEVDFHQLNNGPLFKEKTKEILDEVFSMS